MSLTYARHTDDEFVLNMAQNYGYLLESSYVINQSLDSPAVASVFSLEWSIATISNAGGLVNR